MISQKNDKINIKFCFPRLIGMVYLNDWGALRYAASAAALCEVAADLKLDPDANREFARLQINYILGTRFSYSATYSAIYLSKYILQIILQEYYKYF